VERRHKQDIILSERVALKRESPRVKVESWYFGSERSSLHGRLYVRGDDLRAPSTDKIDGAQELIQSEFCTACLHAQTQNKMVTVRCYTASRQYGTCSLRREDLPDIHLIDVP
jgi:hypothetical protein